MDIEHERMELAKKILWDFTRAGYLNHSVSANNHSPEIWTSKHRCRIVLSKHQFGDTYELHAGTSIKRINTLLELLEAVVMVNPDSTNLIANPDFRLGEKYVSHRRKAMGHV